MQSAAFCSPAASRGAWAAATRVCGCLAGKPILARIIERARPQVAALALNVNGDPLRFARSACRSCRRHRRLRRAAGRRAGGARLGGRHLPEAELSRASPTDAPFLPRDLVRHLAVALAEGGFDLACAQSNGQAHPVFGLWQVVCARICARR